MLYNIRDTYNTVDIDVDSSKYKNIYYMFNLMVDVI